VTIGHGLGGSVGVVSCCCGGVWSEVCEKSSTRRVIFLGLRQNRTPGRFFGAKRKRVVLACEKISIGTLSTDALPTLTVLCNIVLSACSGLKLVLLK
jgi:hypothetical protein